MPPRNPSGVQLDFPALVADVIRDLRLQGTVGLLDFDTAVQPIYIVGARPGGAIFQQQPIIFDGPSIHAASAQNPAVNSVILDTGQLTAGVFDVFCSISFDGGATLDGTFDLQHRDAANAVTLATPFSMAFSQTNNAHTGATPIFALTLTNNDRLRVQTLVNAAQGRCAANIWAQRRPDL